MIVGHGIAIGRNEKSRTDAGDDLMASHLTTLIVIKTVTAEVSLERRAVHGRRQLLEVSAVFGALINPHSHGDHSGLHLFDQIGESCRCLLLGLRRWRRGISGLGKSRKSQWSGKHDCGTKDRGRPEQGYAPY